jgi:hypothetical protein
MTEGPSTLPATRTTNSSSSQASKMNSGGTRLSLQPRMVANGCWRATIPAVRSARKIGAFARPLMNRSLPALRRSIDRSAASCRPHLVVAHGGLRQVTGAGLKSTSALCSFQCSAQVFWRPLADVEHQRNSSQPTSSIVALPSAMRPALTSIRSCQRRARSLRVADLDHRHLGQAVGRAAAGGEDVQVDAAASCSVPQMKSLAGVARRPGPLVMPRSRSFSPGDSTPLIGALPLLTIEPIAFSTMFERPALLVAGRRVGAAVDLALVEVGVVPGHLADHRLGDLGRGRARGQLVDAVAHLGDLGEHHRRAGAHQQVAAEARPPGWR